MEKQIISLYSSHYGVLPRRGGEFMDIDEWRQEILDGVDDLKSAIEKGIKLLKKDVKSWRESVRYRVRNLKA